MIDEQKRRENEAFSKMVRYCPVCSHELNRNKDWEFQYCPDCKRAYLPDELLLAPDDEPADSQE